MFSCGRIDQPDARDLRTLTEGEHDAGFGIVDRHVDSWRNEDDQAQEGQREDKLTKFLNWETYETDERWLWYENEAIEAIGLDNKNTMKQ